MKHKIFITITILALIFSLVGCQNNGIKKPDVETKAITHNSSGDYITFSFDIPSNWKIVAKDTTSLSCFLPDAEELYTGDKVSPYMLSIENYIIPSLIPISDEYKQAYEDLFKGNYDGIKRVISDDIEYINLGKVMENYPNVEFDTPESFMDYLYLLVDGISTPDMELPDKWEEIEWATDFTFKEYNGKNGKFIAIEYSYFIVDKKYKGIICYRDDDISVSGAFDDNRDVSSGDLVLWVADNMEVTEHYRIENNELKQEGIDY